MGNTTVRLLFATALLVLVSGGAFLFRGGLWLSSVQMPRQDFGELPLQLGDWTGRDEDLDPDIVKAIDASNVVNRVYRHPNFGELYAHVAVFADPGKGVSHTPIYCYQGAGWTKVNESRVPLSVGAHSELKASLSKWTRNEKMIQVLYWFEWGDRVLYNRYDLGIARWAMAGQGARPALIKVLVQCSGTESEAVNLERLQDFVSHLTLWMEAATGYSSQESPP